MKFVNEKDLSKLDYKSAEQYMLNNAYELGVAVGQSSIYLNYNVERSHYGRYQKHLSKQFKRCVRGGKYHLK